MMVFVRYFSIIARYHVPEEDRVWDLYILLRKLLPKLMIRSFAEDDVCTIKHLIELFLWTYCDIVQDGLKPMIKKM